LYLLKAIIYILINYTLLGFVWIVACRIILFWVGGCCFVKRPINTFLGFHSVKWVMIFFLTLLFRILRLRPVKMVAEEAQIITTLRIYKKKNNNI